jgi:hypothetical protein
MFLPRFLFHYGTIIVGRIVRYPTNLLSWSVETLISPQSNTNLWNKENFQFLIIVIIVKIKAPLSHVRVTLVYFGCSVFDPSVSCSQNVWIIWLSNLLTLSVPDEGYSERTWWRLFWAYLMKVILSVPDEGYSERTWWRLFWSYLMK